MKHLKRLISSLAVLTLALSLTVAAPAFAHGDEDHSADKQSQAAERKQEAQANAKQRQEERQAKVAEAKTKASEKRADTKKKVCESRKQGLTNKFSRISTNSQRAQDRITSILNKAVTYQQNNNVDAANFDNLVATAQTAKATSQASIDNLKAVTPSVDCNNTSVSSDVAAFKTAAETTRDNLKAYRQAVKEVLKSLQAAKKAEGSNQ